MVPTPVAQTYSGAPENPRAFRGKSDPPAGTRLAWPRMTVDTGDPPMRIDAAMYFYRQSVPIKDVTQVSAGPLSSASQLMNASPSGVTTTDFTSMTRQQLFDWMNGQIRSGTMSLQESSPFLGMTVKIDTRTQQPVDMATDSAPVNFMDRARQGIAGALSRGDSDEAARLHAALDTMQRYQGQMSGVDIRA